MKTEFACPTAAKPNEPIDGPALHSRLKNTPRGNIGSGAAASYTSRNGPELQARAFVAPAERAGSSGLRGVRSATRPALAPQRIILRGDAAVLRQLRAAEMAAWEASCPNTRSEPKGSISLRRGSVVYSKVETWLLLVLGAAAGAAVMIGLVDLHNLLAR